MFLRLQQLLPFTVLKHTRWFPNIIRDINALQQLLPFTVLKQSYDHTHHDVQYVATALTVYGIETFTNCYWHSISNVMLQQLLPFTVLKLTQMVSLIVELMSCNSSYRLRYWNILGNQKSRRFLGSCNSSYRLRYWNQYNEAHFY